MLLVPQTAATAPNVILAVFFNFCLFCLCFFVLFFFLSCETCLDETCLVCLGGQLLITCFWRCLLFLCFCVFFFLPVACPSCCSLRIYVASGLGYFVPLFGLPLLSVIFFGRGVCSRVFLLSFVFSFFSFVLSFFCFFLNEIIFVSFNVSGLLACVCCARRIQYDDMVLRCLIPLRHYDVLVVSLVS